MSNDPFKFLGVPYDADLRAIRERFKKLVLIYHPDRKTGNTQTFNEIKTAYKQIYNFRKTQEENEALSGRTRQSIEQTRAMDDAKYKPRKIDERLFDRMFDQSVIHDPWKEGRQSFLKTENVGKKTNQLAIISNPQPCESFATDSAKPLGTEKVKDFSVYEGKVKCFDVMHAYEQKENLEKIIPNVRKTTDMTEQGIAEYTSMRNNIALSESEKELQKQYRKEQDSAEMRRQYIMYQNKRLAERQFSNFQQNILPL